MALSNVSLAAVGLLHLLGAAEAYSPAARSVTHSTILDRAEDLLPEYDYVIFDIKYDTSYWGSTSNVHASFPSFSWPVLKMEMSAFGDIPRVEYPSDSGSGETGAYWHPASVDPATVLRSFARPGHWDGIEAARSNYYTLTGQKVLKVSFRGKRATGVVFVPADAKDQSQARSVKAKKEIIMAAGSIHTPQILQASGVGPKQLLKEARIPLVVDSPGVGSNFQDQPFNIDASFNRSHSTPTFYDMLLNQTFIDEAQAQFDANRTRPMTIASGNCGSWLSLQVIAPKSWKDIAKRYDAQDAAAYLPRGTDKSVIAGYKAQQQALAKSMRSKKSAAYNFFLRGGYEEGSVVYLHPTSRGTVHINRADPFFSPPEVDYRALNNPIDLEVLLEFTSFTRKYFLETRMKTLDPIELSPGADVTAPAEIEAWIRSVMIPSSFHPIGTAAMMPKNLGGVVDEDLLVYGVQGLSVVDASVMPDLPGSSTQQTVYAVAEKAADLIKARA